MIRTLAPTRFVPADSVKVVDKRSDAIAYVYSLGGRPCAVGYAGKQTKPAFFLRFSSEARRERHIREFFAGRQASLAFKAERQAEARKPHSFQEGHILVSSWGYDQTNVDWYEVTKVVGARTIEIRKIAAVVDHTASDQGRCFPRAGEYLGEATRHVVSRGSVRVSSCAYARLWDGRARAWSSYH